ncbi:MAG: alpha/beta fold hydrolase [Candidatus Latescibacteria bacterium]|nr:alpha/beta fold hydrolase [Candidatus Latescibacterota bacterium]MBT4140232.1 alpha/beta fold hydrolase [Candidatus Latescibacterota bacterium]MBT5830231.1 alpha/beta fold hydrolase [Candidatus Latescibacterota bacterium]
MFGDIKNNAGEKLDYVVHQGNANSKQIVVLGHGVTGNKDRPFLVALADGLESAGINVLRFSFAGNGDSDGRFEDAVITKEVDDLGRVIDALDGYTICFVGHSMGGAVGVLRASTDGRIQYLISLAGMVDTKGFAEREFGDVTPDAGNMWDDEDCPLSSAYMNDLTALDTVVNRATQIHVPWLLVHGTEDDVVPIEDSQLIFTKANEPKELVELPGADHVFGDADTAVMVEKVVTWVQGQFA